VNSDRYKTPGQKQKKELFQGFLIRSGTYRSRSYYGGQGFFNGIKARMKPEFLGLKWEKEIAVQRSLSPFAINAEPCIDKLGI